MPLARTCLSCPVLYLAKGSELFEAEITQRIIFSRRESFRGCIITININNNKTLSRSHWAFYPRPCLCLKTTTADIFIVISNNLFAITIAVIWQIESYWKLETLP